MQSKIKYLFIIFVFYCFMHNLQASSSGYSRLLLYGNCITCHHPTKSISAPSLKIIKQRYHDAFNNKDLFVSYMVQWVYKSTKKGSIMHDMIDKYELMPQLGYQKDTLEEIAEYIYENEIEDISAY